MPTAAEERATARKQLIATYKNRSQILWGQGIAPGWKEHYARDGEAWDPNLWGSRYGGATTIEVADASGGHMQTGSGAGHSTRGAYGSKIMMDGINMFEQMKDDELDSYIKAGNIQEVAKEYATNQILALADHLKATQDKYKDTTSFHGGSMDPGTNSITGNAMDRSKEAKKKAKPPAAPTPPPPPPKLSASGIAYDTVEYREQCFLLSQLFKIVTHRRDVLENPGPGVWDTPAETAIAVQAEYKRLPYVDEGVTQPAKDGTPGEVLPPTNACLMVEANHPYAFINRLTQYPTGQSFLSLPTSDISQLQPQIRLFRVSENVDSTGKTTETNQEMHFNTSTTQQDISNLGKTAAKRGFGTGIKSFTVNYEASNPFALKKSISATLVIFANTFDELTMDRGGYSYIDLALKTGGVKTIEKFSQEHGSALNVKERARLYNLSKLNFRLKAVVGWMRPPGSALQGFNTKQIGDMLSNSFVTVNLTPTIHTFDFDEMGRVTFKIEYLAYIEDFFDEPSYSVFSDRSLVKRHKEREREYRMIADKCDAESMKKIKEKMGVATAKDLAQARANMWRELKSSQKLRFINLKYETLRKYQELGPYFKLGEAEEEAWNVANITEDMAISDGLAKAIKDYDRTKGKAMGHKDTKKALSQTQVQLVFFYVSDLLDIILKGIEEDLSEAINYYASLPKTGGDTTSAAQRYEAMDSAMQRMGIDDDALYAGSTEEMGKTWDELKASMAVASKTQGVLDLARARQMHSNFQRYRLLLGPIEIINPENPSDSKTVNLGDLPISYKYFMEWLTSRTLTKDKPYYPLAAFLNDFFNGLINGFINDAHCFPRGRAQSRQRTTLNQSAITAYKSKKEDPDPISKLLRRWRVVKQRNTGIDVSRLHLENHDGTAIDPREGWPILSVSGQGGSQITFRDVPYEINYACYFAGRTAPDSMMNGNIEEDVSRGIMHYMAGRDRGIIKNIKFQKTETPGLRELRYEQEGYNGLSQLREVYNVTIDTFANVTAFPGSYIFVDPKGLAPNMDYSGNSSALMPTANDLTTYGLGGYYMINRSSHTFGAGKADTRIDAVWVAEIGNDAAAGTQTGGFTPLDKEERLIKCSINKQGNMEATQPEEPKSNVDKPE